MVEVTNTVTIVGFVYNGLLHKLLKKTFGVDQHIVRATVVRGSNGTRPPGSLAPLPTT